MGCIFFLGFTLSVNLFKTLGNPEDPKQRSRSIPTAETSVILEKQIPVVSRSIMTKLLNLIIL